MSIRNCIVTKLPEPSIVGALYPCYPPIMESIAALRVFGLHQGSTVKELNTSFRKLVKTYHPDMNADRSDWAHEQMIKLNNAYEVAFDYLIKNTNGTVIYQSSDAIPSKIMQESFEKAVDLVLQALFIYYQYGLDNIYLRMEGVRRYRLNYIKRMFKDAHALFEQIVESDPQNPKFDLFDNIKKLTLALIQEIYLKIPSHPRGDSFEIRAYNHFFRGSRALHYSIKTRLFGESLRVQEGMRLSLNLRRSFEEFMIVLTQYTKSEWTPATLIKLYLLEIYEKVEPVLIEKARL